MKIQGSPDLICNNFYQVLENPDDDWALKPGQLFYAHITYPETHPKILKLSKYDPRNERNTIFTIVPYNDGDEKHYPIRELNLRSNELLYVYKGKRRLVVLLGHIESTWIKEKPQEYMLCAPVFSFKDYHSQEMVLRTQAFLFPNLFYLPPDRNGCPNESAIRFELIQSINRNSLDSFFCHGKNQPVRLTDEAFWIMLCRLIKFLNGKVIDAETEELIKIYSQLLTESYKS